MNNKNKSRNMILTVCSFILILTAGIVNASLFSDMGTLESQGCNIVNNAGADISELSSRFGGGSDCSLIIDKFPLWANTISLIEDEPFYYTGVYLDYYAQAEYINGDLFLFGENDIAIQNLIDLVAGYDVHSGIFSEDSAIFFSDGYFAENFSDSNFVPEDGLSYYSVENCIDESPLTLFEENFGSYIYNETFVEFGFSCISEKSISAPYCVNSTTFSREFKLCDCMGDRCIPAVRNVFSMLYNLDGENIGDKYLYSVIKNWLDN